MALKVRTLFALDARSLAVFRMGLAILILFDLVTRAAHLTLFYTDNGVLPRALAFQEFDLQWRISAYFVNGSPQVAWFFFILAGFAGVALLVGFRTRFAAFLSWFMLMSLHVRNPMVLDSGDHILRLLLFWSLFVPLGSCWSLDAKKKGKGINGSGQFLSVGTFALLAQIVFIYWFSAGLKLGNAEWRAGEAAYLALNVSQIQTTLSQWALQFPFFLKALTYATLTLEILGPLMLFCPFWTAPIRMFAIFLFLVMHFGFALFLDLGGFAMVNWVAMLPLLPPAFWQWVERKNEKVLSRPAGASSLVNIMAGVCLLYVLFWNLGTVIPKMKMPNRLQWFGYLLHIEQQWKMFVPPGSHSSWFIASSKLSDEREVDLFNDGGEMDWEKIHVRSNIFRGTRWNNYFLNVKRKDFREQLPFLCEFLCRQWNDQHEASQKVRETSLYLMYRYFYPQAGDLERVLILNHRCS